MNNLARILERDDFVVDYVVIPAGEESKCLSVYANVLECLLEKNIRRNE